MLIQLKRVGTRIHILKHFAMQHGLHFSRPQPPTFVTNSCVGMGVICSIIVSVGVRVLV